VQPVKVEIRLPIPAATVRGWSNGRYRRERILRPVHAVAFAFRRSQKRDVCGGEYVVEVLARIPSGYRIFVKRWQWLTNELAWVDALVALNPSTLTPFVSSGDREWRVGVHA
jgi:hypothetical protein